MSGEIRVRNAIASALLGLIALLLLFQQSMRPKQQQQAYGSSILFAESASSAGNLPLLSNSSQGNSVDPTCSNNNNSGGGRDDDDPNTLEALVFAQRSRIRLDSDRLVEFKQKKMATTADTAIMSIRSTSPLMQTMRQKKQERRRRRQIDGETAASAEDVAASGLHAELPQVDVVYGLDEDYSWMLPPWQTRRRPQHTTSPKTGEMKGSVRDEEEEELFCITTEFEPRFFREIPEFTLKRTVFVALPFGACGGGVVQLHELASSAHIHETIGRSIRIVHNSNLREEGGIVHNSGGGVTNEELTVFCVYECLRDPYCRYMILEESNSATSICHHFSTFYDELAERDHTTQGRLLRQARRFRILQFAYRRDVPASLVRSEPLLRVTNGPLDVVRVGDDGKCFECRWRITVENMLDTNRLEATALPVTLVVEDLGPPEKLDMTLSSNMNKNGTLVFVTGATIVRGTHTFHFEYLVGEFFRPYWGHQWRVSIVADGTALGIAKSALKTTFLVVVQGHPQPPPTAVLITTGTENNKPMLSVQHDAKICGRHIREDECCITNIALRMRGGRQMPQNAIYDSSNNFEGRLATLSLRSSGGLGPDKACDVAIVEGEAAIEVSAAANFDRLVIRSSCARKADVPDLPEGKLTFVAKTNDHGSPELEVPAEQLLRSCGRRQQQSSSSLPAAAPVADGATLLPPPPPPASTSGSSAAAPLTRILVSTYFRPRCRTCVVQHLENILTFLPHASVVMLLGRDFTVDDRQHILKTLQELKPAGQCDLKTATTPSEQQHGFASCGSIGDRVFLHVQPQALDRLFEPWLVSIAHGLNLDFYESAATANKDKTVNNALEYSHVVFWNSEHLFVRTGVEEYVSRYNMSSFVMLPSNANSFAQSQPPWHVHVHRPDAIVDDSLALVSGFFLPVGRAPTGLGMRDEFHLGAIMRKYNVTKYVREPTAMAGSFLSKDLAKSFRKILLEDFFYSAVALLNETTGAVGNAPASSIRKGHLKLFEFYHVGEVVLATFFQPLCRQNGGSLACGERISSTAHGRHDEVVEERDVKRVRCSVAELPFGLAKFREGDQDPMRLLVQGIQRDSRRQPLARDDEQFCK